MRTLALLALAAACTTAASGAPPDSAADVVAAMDLPAPQDVPRTDGGRDADVAAPSDASTKVDCDPARVRCNALPPECAGGGEVPSVRNGCWGACVVYTACAPIACDPDVPGACPRNLVCYRSTRRCGPYL